MSKVIRGLADMRVLRQLVSFSVLAVFFGSTCLASGGNTYHIKIFELKGSCYFSEHKDVVSRYLRERSPRRRAHACVVGLRITGQRDDTAWVIWPGGDKLILWQGGGDDDLNRSNRQLSLRRDVVASDEAVGTSTYLVSRPWVTALERKCAQSGRQVTVN